LNIKQSYFIIISSLLTFLCNKDKCYLQLTISPIKNIDKNYGLKMKKTVTSQIGHDEKVIYIQRDYCENVCISADMQTD
jgi:hypothetical protein